LEGKYGEYLPPNQCIDDIFPWGQTYESFQDQYPGVITFKDAPDGQLITMTAGAGWNFVSGSEHAPVGWIGERGLLMAQIFWPGPNEILPDNTTAAAGTAPVGSK
jgi:hypothetical protein